MADVAINSDSAYIPAVNFTEVGSDPTAPTAGHVLLYVKSGVLYVRQSGGTVSAVGAAPALTEHSLGVGDGSGLLSALSPGAEGAVPTRQSDGSIAEVVPTPGGGGGGSSPIHILPCERYAYTGHDLAITNLAGAYAGFIWQASGGAQNDDWSYHVDMAAGTWSIGLLRYDYSGYAIVTFYIDGSSVGTIDTYSAGGTTNNYTQINGVTVATGGLKVLKLGVPTKNASSSGYLVGLSMIVLIRTA